MLPASNPSAAVRPTPVAAPATRTAVHSVAVPVADVAATPAVKSLGAHARAHSTGRPGAVKLTPLCLASARLCAGVAPIALAAAVAGAAAGAVLSGGKKRVYGKGLSQLLPSDASALAKNIACVLCPTPLSHALGVRDTPGTAPP
jgi:hypothetical protein